MLVRSRLLEGHTNFVSCLAISGDVLAASAGMAIQLWDLSTGEPRGRTATDDRTV